MGNNDQAQSALAKYSIDLTAQAAARKLDPVIARDGVLRRVTEVLSRRSKSNPVLLGPPGAGKTALASGIAQRIIDGDVPESLKGARVMALDVGLLVAGAAHRGEFESRLKQVISEAEEGVDGRPVVLFVDELHTLMGAGAVGGGALDAANMIKPALARGLKCIGATTPDEYRRYIESDSAMARRFCAVNVDEASVEDSVAVLRGLKERFELHHGVSIRDSALTAAVRLSSRYITDRFLPDKAIDLVDEACARLKISQSTKPANLETIDRALVIKRIELAALQKETTGGADLAAKRGAVEATIRDLEEQSQRLSKVWAEDKALMERRSGLKRRLDALRGESQAAQKAGNYAKASELLYSDIPAVQKELDALNAQKTELVGDAVAAEEVAAVLSRSTGIPIDHLLNDKAETERLLNLASELSRKVIGQGLAVDRVASAIQLSRAGLQNPKKPTATFLFLGPTGCGKTELAKTIGEFMHFDAMDSSSNSAAGSSRSMLRIDCSEFSESHKVATLIGAPPGYVGFEKAGGGVLTNFVAKRPFSMVLFDEIEKAHPDLHNLLLQLLDEGKLRDSSGRVVDFRNTIVVCTSNVGALHYASLADGEPGEKVRPAVLEDLSRVFRPEMINRFDEIVTFNPLSSEAVRGIAALQVSEVAARLKDRGVDLKVDASALDLFAKDGYSHEYGARPLRRLIQRELALPLARGLLKGDIAQGQTVSVTVQDNKLKFDHQ